MRAGAFLLLPDGRIRLQTAQLSRSSTHPRRDATKSWVKSNAQRDSAPCNVYSKYDYYDHLGRRNQRDWSTCDYQMQHGYGSVRHFARLDTSQLGQRPSLFGHMISSTRNVHSDSSKGVFVSDHFRIPKTDLDQLISRMGWKALRRGDWMDMELCPSEVCQGTPQQQSNKGEGDNRFTFGVNVYSGSFQCFRCKVTGSWLELKRQLNDDIVVDKLNIQDIGRCEASTLLDRFHRIMRNGMASPHACSLPTSFLCIAEPWDIVSVSGRWFALVCAQLFHRLSVTPCMRQKT
jgi:hypothetical protein